MNPGPIGYEPSALTTELRAHVQYMVGVKGFEPSALCSQSRCATKLRYTPIKCGRGRRTRTLGTRFWRPLLYQLSYAPVQGVWRRRWDSNPCGPKTNPNGLANRPLQPLEYFSGLHLPLSDAVFWRRGWDSNPRPLSESPVFKTGSLNRSDTSPNAGIIFGDPSEIRTRDTLIKSQVLCHLS